MFGPGRARREQPNAGLHLGVRAFVRSVSHVKVLVGSLFAFLGGSLRRALSQTRPRRAELASARQHRKTPAGHREIAGGGCNNTPGRDF